MFAGGGEELDWTLSVLFDAMGAMSSKYNDTPERRQPRLRQGPRRLRDLRRRRHAGARGARGRPRARRQDLRRGRSATAPPPTAPTWWRPSGEGAVRCMKLAMAASRARHGAMRRSTTSTPMAPRRRSAISPSSTPSARYSATTLPTVSSTKSLTGHSQGATGAHEAIYSLLMLKDDFVAASANIENLDPGAEGYPIAAPAHRQCRPADRDVEQLRLRRHQRLPAVLALRPLRGTCLTTGPLRRPDAPAATHTPRPPVQSRRLPAVAEADGRQARPDHGRRQRAVDRLGHRPGPARRRRRACLHLPGRGVRQARAADGREARLEDRRTRPTSRTKRASTRCSTA